MSKKNNKHHQTVVSPTPQPVVETPAQIVEEQTPPVEIVPDEFKELENLDTPADTIPDEEPVIETVQVEPKVKRVAKSFGAILSENNAIRKAKIEAKRNAKPE